MAKANAPAQQEAPTIKGYCAPEFSVKAADDETRTLTHLITAKSVDRDSEVIIPGGCRAENFLRNPLVFLNHLSWTEPPIGQCMSLKISDAAMEAETRFAGLDQLHPQAEMIYRLYRDGFMRSWSIGFRPITVSNQAVLPGQKGNTITEWELLEYSAVGIPANPDAVMRMAKAFELPEGASEKDLLDAIKAGKPQVWWDLAKSFSVIAPTPSTEQKAEAAHDAQLDDEDVANEKSGTNDQALLMQIAADVAAIKAELAALRTPTVETAAKSEPVASEPVAENTAALTDAVKNAAARALREATAG